MGGRTARITIRADRWVACIREFAFVGWDFTDAVFAAQVRAVPDSTGAALIDLATVTTASAEGVRLIEAAIDTIANHIAAGRIAAVPTGFLESDEVALSLVGLRINETSMEALPFPDDTGDDIAFTWDMHITPSGGLKDKYCGGDFVVLAGVTQ